MTTDNRFGLRLRQLRAQRGYSQERPAELSGMSIDGISNLERALSLPGLDKGGNAAERAGCAGLKLLDYMGGDAGPDPERRRLEDELLRASRTLDLNVLEVASAQIEALKKLGK
jgi:transcriptional regulator with XRE-family HTH domain